MPGPRPDPPGRAREIPVARLPSARPDERVRAFQRLSAADRQALLVERCTAELRRRALLLDPERLLELTTLRIAAFAGPAPVEPEDDWLSECISGAIDQARRIDRERAQAKSTTAAEDYRFLTEVFFVSPDDAARATHAFNELPRSTRRATLELLLHCKPVRTCLQEGIAEDQKSLVDRARHGLLTIMQLDDSVLPESTRKRSLGKADREGIATILGQQAAVLMHGDDSCKDLLHRSVRLGECLDLSFAATLASRASEVLSEGHHLGKKELSYLASIERGSPGIDRLQANLLAWRLCPLDNLAIQGALEYMFRHEWESSMRLLEPVFRKPQSRLHLSYAYEALGAIRVTKGDLQQASAAFQEASDCGEQRPAPLGSWFLLSLALGNGREAEEAGKRIEEMLGSEASDLDSWVPLYLALRKKGVFDARVHPRLQQSKWVFGYHTKRIAEALL